MYDYIHYLMAGISKEEISQMPNTIQKNMSLYFKEHSDEISKFKTGNFSKKDIDMDTFCRVCKKDIDKSILSEQDVNIDR